MGLSSYPFNELQTQKNSIEARAKSSIEKAKKEEQAIALLEADLNKSKVSSTSENRLLTDKFQDFIYGVKSIAASRNITITTLTPKDGRTMSVTARELSAVAVPLLTAPNIKVVTIDIRGKFDSVDDLKWFLDFLKGQQIAIGKLNVNRDIFIVTVDIYGV